MSSFPAKMGRAGSVSAVLRQTEALAKQENSWEGLPISPHGESVHHFALPNPIRFHLSKQ